MTPLILLLGAAARAGYDVEAPGELIRDAHVTHFITRLGGDPERLARPHRG